MYNHDHGTYSFIRKMMALPFLPEREIELMFQCLQCQASESLQPFTEYVSSNWIHGTTWGHSDWTAFKKAAHTNDFEGWHHGLNHQAWLGQLPLYLLTQLLHREARLTALHICLVSDRKLKKIQRHKYYKLKAKLFDLWDEFEAKQTAS